MFIGFNQKRDRFVTQNVALVCFVFKKEKSIIPEIMKKMSDSWSVRSNNFLFEKEIESSEFLSNEIISDSYSSIGGETVAEKKEYIKKQEKRIEELLKKDNKRLIIKNLIPFLSVLEDVTDYEKGFFMPKSFWN